MLIHALTLLALAATPATQDPGSAVRYERRGDHWFRHEDGLEYPVDPRVVSVRFRDRSVNAATTLRSLDGSLTGLHLVRSNRLGVHDLEIPEGADPLQVVRDLRDTGLFEFAEENTLGHHHLIPDDPGFPNQWNLHNTGQGAGTPDADIDAPEAWDIEDGDPSIVIAVIDSGADESHPDLAASFWMNPGELPNGIDDDGNGFIDDFTGWDFVDNDNDPTGNTSHGTQVAGVPGAVANNAFLLAGLAGGAMDGAGCRIMNLQMSNAMQFKSSVVDDAIVYAVDNGARVITMSLGMGTSNAMTQALTYADAQGVFVNCSAGNNGVRVEYPARDPLVVAVGASNNQDNSAGFSGRGPQIDIVAPGSTMPLLNLGGGVTSSSGTSFSSPTVAALAGLILSRNPSLNHQAVRQILHATADDIDAPGWDTNTGWGRINAHQALLVADTFVPYDVQLYGSGLPGVAGVIPMQSFVPGQRPVINSPGFGMFLFEALPSTGAILILGSSSASLPFKGGSLLVLPAPYFKLFPGATDASGSSTRTLPIPNDPALVGGTFYTQWIVSDPNAVQGTSLTAGLAVTIGPKP